MSSLYPAFTISPGESGATALERLLALVPDALFFSGGTAYLTEPKANDAGTYSYGTDHRVFRAAYRSSAQSANRVQVYASDLLSESFVWSEIATVYDRLLQVHDLNLTTASQAQDRANAELRREAIVATGGYVVAPPNCAQELHDVIDITDSRAGLSAAKRRVLGLTLRYARTPRPLYEQEIKLGGV